MPAATSNIPNPDPSIIANERLAEALVLVNGKMDRNRDESKNWIERLQELLEEKIRGAEDKTLNLDRVVQTRLAGSETALNAAMAAADKVTQKQADNFEAVLKETKVGMATQITSINEKIDDLKERMSEASGTRGGITEAATSHHSNNQSMISIAAIIVVIIIAAVGWLRDRPEKVVMERVPPIVQQHSYSPVSSSSMLAR